MSVSVKHVMSPQHRILKACTSVAKSEHSAFFFEAMLKLFSDYFL